jgi:hypothetical protein
VANSGKDFRLILLNLLAPAAAIAQLPAVQLLIDEFDVDRKLRGQAGNKREERLSMRFTGGVKLQHSQLHSRSLLAITSLETSSVAAAALSVQQVSLAYE